jgi:hypothetical protein
MAVIHSTRSASRASNRPLDQDRLGGDAGTDQSLQADAAAAAEGEKIRGLQGLRMEVAPGVAD